MKKRSDASKNMPFAHILSLHYQFRGTIFFLEFPYYQYNSRRRRKKSRAVNKLLFCSCALLFPFTISRAKRAARERRRSSFSHKLERECIVRELNTHTHRGARTHPFDPTQKKYTDKGETCARRARRLLRPGFSAGAHKICFGKDSHL